MKNILEELFHSSVKEMVNSVSVIDLEKEIEINKKQLKEDLSKKQKKLLLRIEDGKNLIIEESNLDSFIAGFKIGLTVGYETNRE